MFVQMKTMLERGFVQQLRFWISGVTYSWALCWRTTFGGYTPVDWRTVLPKTMGTMLWENEWPHIAKDISMVVRMNTGCSYVLLSPTDMYGRVIKDFTNYSLTQIFNISLNVYGFHYFGFYILDHRQNTWFKPIYISDHGQIKKTVDLTCYLILPSYYSVYG